MSAAMTPCRGRHRGGNGRKADIHQQSKRAVAATRYRTSPRWQGMRSGLERKIGRNRSNLMAQARKPNPTATERAVAAVPGAPTAAAKTKVADPKTAADT